MNGVRRRSYDSRYSAKCLEKARSPAGSYRWRIACQPRLRAVTPGRSERRDNVVPIRPEPAPEFVPDPEPQSDPDFDTVIDSFRQIESTLEAGVRPTAEEMREIESCMMAIVERLARIEAAACSELTRSRRRARTSLATAASREAAGAITVPGPLMPWPWFESRSCV